MSSGADPLNALAWGVSLGGDTQPKSRSTVDTTADWKLGRKSLSEDKAKEVTAMVSALAMNVSLKVKTLKSITIYVPIGDQRLSSSRYIGTHENDRKPQPTDGAAKRNANMGVTLRSC